MWKRRHRIWGLRGKTHWGNKDRGCVIRSWPLEALPVAGPRRGPQGPTLLPFPPPLLLLFLNIYLFIFGCAGPLLLHAGLSLVLERGASRCDGFSCCGAWAPAVTAPGLISCGSQALEHGLSSGGAWVYLPVASGIFLDQGSNLQVDFYPVYHQGRSSSVFLPIMSPCLLSAWFLTVSSLPS